MPRKPIDPKKVVVKRRTPRSQHRAMGKCGATTKNGTPCQKPAGYGTTHVGIGKCRFHGGTKKNSRKAAIVKEAIVFMGAPLDINPLDAIIWCIKITAGEIQFLGEQIAAVPPDQWIEHAIIGKQMNILQRARADAQDRLVRYSKDAISLGLAERAIRMAEQFGVTIARLLEGVYQDLELTPAQKKRWPIIVRKHLILMEGGRVIEKEDREQPLWELPPARQKPRVATNVD
jgi:hypothetical protein